MSTHGCSLLVAGLPALSCLQEQSYPGPQPRAAAASCLALFKMTCLFLGLIIGFCLPETFPYFSSPNPRCHLGTTVDCTTNGVGPIKG